ncbi:hypothetical protein FJ567_09470 [Mesorhizobium sp. B2-4-16]|nr:hypothetical protein FJ567_09470 [Mesorhizobium sp. B2-4-16]TPL78296.1 hypothetical protein FJ956_01750 [Mesorhizobium sp. B2-4-3]
MRGAPGNTNVSLRWNTPHPSRRCAPIHLLPQGEKGKRFNAPRTRSASSPARRALPASGVRRDRAGR